MDRENTNRGGSLRVGTVHRADVALTTAIEEVVEEASTLAAEEEEMEEGGILTREIIRDLLRVNWFIYDRERKGKVRLCECSYSSVDYVRCVKRNC